MTKQKLETISKIGYEACILAIGNDIFEKYKNNSCFAHDTEIYDESKGLRCFVGLTIKTSKVKNLYLDNENDDEMKGWDFYATCVVKNGVASDVICKKSKRAKAQQCKIIHRN